MAFVADSSVSQAHRRFISIALSIAVFAGAAVACLSSTVALAATTSTSCNLYASTSGSDSNPGTATAPFATAKHLLEKLSAGQTGCLTSGQTFAGFTMYEGNTHGTEGKPITLSSTNPEEPATVTGRVVTEKGADWLTFTHLNFVYGQDTLFPSITIASAHTSWTYDDVSGAGLNICFLTNPVGDSYGTGEYTLIEHDRVHDCGHPVTKAELEAQANDTYEGRENGWHTHGLYDEGTHTTVKNSYFYDVSGVGILLRSGGFAMIEHNVIDASGRGVEFGNEGTESDTVAWNIITDSTSPCGREVAGGSHCDTYGLIANGTVGTGSVFRDNDVYGNEGGNIEPGVNSIIAREANIEVNPLYTNAAAHEYALRPGSPATGYGPDSELPIVTSTAPTETTPTSPPATEATPTPPPVTETTPASPPATKTTPISYPVTTETTPVSSSGSSETTGTKKQGRRHSSAYSRSKAKVASLRSRKGRRDARTAKRRHRAKKVKS